jgi:hypothetical protein
MADVYFHYSSARGVIDEAPQRPPSVEDWRGWILHVTDDDGDEIFEVLNCIRRAQCSRNPHWYRFDKVCTRL